jgi:transposase
MQIIPIEEESLEILIIGDFDSRKQLDYLKGRRSHSAKSYLPR